MNKEKAELSRKYCECEYIKQTDMDIVDLFDAPMPIDQTPRIMYQRLKRKFLIIFATGNIDLEFTRSDCLKCFRPILELQDVDSSSAFVAKQKVPEWGITQIKEGKNS
jgi:hypothetical protein